MFGPMLHHSTRGVIKALFFLRHRVLLLCEFHLGSNHGRHLHNDVIHTGRSALARSTDKQAGSSPPSASCARVCAVYDRCLLPLSRHSYVHSSASHACDLFGLSFQEGEQRGLSANVSEVARRLWFGHPCTDRPSRHGTYPPCCKSASSRPLNSASSSTRDIAPSRMMVMRRRGRG